MPTPHPVPPREARKEQEHLSTPREKRAGLVGFPQLPPDLAALLAMRSSTLQAVPATRCQVVIWNGLGMLGMVTVVIFSPRGWSGGLPLLLPLPT